MRNQLVQSSFVVSTSPGFEGIALEAGQHVLIADSPKQFATAVLRLLNDPRLGRRLAENGRRLIEDKYDYREACRPLDEVYAQAAASTGARR